MLWLGLMWTQKEKERKKEHQGHVYIIGTFKGLM
jgi:hypothetical protein